MMRLHFFPKVILISRYTKDIIVLTVIGGYIFLVLSLLQLEGKYKS